mmetsp:Transcript_58020/g.147316  ORF Transcript_58020/g.147316 Transcript_58020/m.147316 type:complete len:381 (+) Transcript_58020:40-1182(+)
MHREAPSHAAGAPPPGAPEGEGSEGSPSSTENMRTHMPRPSAQPRPAHSRRCATPSFCSAVRTDSARACESFIFAALLSSGLPFVWPSQRTAKSGNSFRMRASSAMVSATVISISTLLGSKVIVPFSRALLRSRLSNFSCSSRERPEASGISRVPSRACLGSATNMRRRVPRPTSQPRPTHLMLQLVAPSAKTAVLKAWARWCESFFFAALFSAGWPLAWPSQRRSKSANACKTLATLRTASMQERGTSEELGSKSTPFWRDVSRSSFSTCSRASREKPARSGISTSEALRSSASTTSIRKPAPRPSALPSPTHIMALSAPSSLTAARTASARPSESLRFASLFSCGLPFAWPSKRKAMSGKALSTRATIRTRPRAEGGR